MKRASEFNGDINKIRKCSILSVTIIPSLSITKKSMDHILKNIRTQGLPLPISKRKIPFGISCPRALKLRETQNTQNSQLGENHVAIPNSRVALKVPSPSNLDIDHLQVWLMIIHIFSQDGIFSSVILYAYLGFIPH